MNQRSPTLLPKVLPDLRLVNAGTNYDHHPDYRIDRPHGSGDHLFVHFLTPIVIRDVHGERTMPAGTCILYAPGYHQWYHGLDKGYVNNWCHFEGDTVPALVQRCGIHTNEAIMPVVAQPLGTLIAGLEREQLRREPHWQDGCTGLLLQLLVAIARSLASATDAGESLHRRALAERLHDLRLRVHKHLAKDWTVAEMAHEMHLSASRFAHAYRQVFGVAPMSDLIGARISHACWMLSNGRAMVKETAAACGFSDLHHFSRCFRARVGCAPRDYAHVQQTRVSAH